MIKGEKIELENKERYNKRREKRPETKKFIELVAVPGMKKTKALLIAQESGNPKNGLPNIGKIAAYKKSKALRNHIEERKQIAAQFANVTPEMVLGATAMRAFASIDEAFDEDGNFDIIKARKSGAIHLVKRLRSTPFGIDAEFYSNETAQQQLANYLGMEFAPKDNSDVPSLKAGIEAAAIAIAQELGVEINHEIRILAFEKVLVWISESKAKYSQKAIDEVSMHFQRVRNRE